MYSATGQVTRDGRNVTRLAFLSNRLGQKTISEKLFKIDERLDRIAWKIVVPLQQLIRSMSPTIPG